jgi:hypothetical protein
LFIGRFAGCTLFLAIAKWGSGVAALRYALPVIALLQLLSIRVAGRILRELKMPVPFIPEPQPDSSEPRYLPLP